MKDQKCLVYDLDNAVLLPLQPRGTTAAKCASSSKRFSKKEKNFGEKLGEKCWKTRKTLRSIASGRR